MEQAKLLSITVVLTTLIWTSADSLVNETVSVRVTFEVESREDPNLRVELAQKDRIQFFDAHLFGPRSVADELRKRDPLRIRLPISTRPIGAATLLLDRDMVMREMTEQWHEFRKLRLVSVEPDTLDVVIDRMMAKEVALTLNRLSLAYHAEPQPRQTVVQATLRESEYQRLTAEGQPLQIDISNEVERLLRGKPAGQSTTVTVSLDVRSLGRDARLKPDRVEVMATVRADRQTAAVSTVPIKPVVSFANLDRSYLAVAGDGTPFTLVTQTIRVTGPTEEVSRLLRGDTRAYGFIQIKEADFEQMGVLRAWTPEFHLPPGLKLAEEPQVIEFKLISKIDADLSR